MCERHELCSVLIIGGRWRRRESHEPGDAGNERRMDVDDIDVMLGEVLAELPGPPEVECVRAAERHGLDAHVLDHRNEVVLPVEDVADGEPETGGVGGASKRNEEMFSTTRTEALDEPEHVDSVVGARCRHALRTVGPVTTSAG